MGIPASGGTSIIAPVDDDASLVDAVALSAVDAVVVVSSVDAVAAVDVVSAVVKLELIDALVDPLGVVPLDALLDELASVVDPTPPFPPVSSPSFPHAKTNGAPARHSELASRPSARTWSLKRDVIIDASKVPARHGTAKGDAAVCVALSSF